MLSALLDVCDNILSTLSEGADCVDMIYLDFAKTFDKVDNGLLCHKLKKFGIGTWCMDSQFSFGPYSVCKNPWRC